MTDIDQTPEQAPAQKHYAEAERLLVGATEAETDRSLPPVDRGDKADRLLLRAQVHATLAQAASNEVLIGFLTEQVTLAAVDRIRSAFGLNQEGTE